MKTLGLSIALGAVFTGANVMGGVIKSTDLLKRKVLGLKSQRLELGKKFGFASKEAKKLNKDILRISKNAKRLDRIFAMQKGIKSYRKNFKDGFMDKVALGAIVFAPLKVAIDFESAMADVKKVVNFDSNAELKIFQKEITSLSKKIPLSAKGLARIVASGGQLGIAKNKLIEFTTTTAKMSTAFDMMPEEAGESVAKLMNVFGLGLKEVKSLGDAINHLSDNTASKAKDIVNVLARVGGSAKVFGFSAKQTSSLAGALLSLGKPAEVTATAMNALFLKLGTADRQGAKFKKALADMGLDTQTLKDNIKENGEGAIVDFLQRINEIDSDEKMGVLSDLFGAEYSDDIALLSGGIDNYTKSIKLLGKEQNYTGSMQKEFEARSATTANNLKLLGNTISAIAINFGSVLLPAINSALVPLRAFSSWVGNVIAEYPTLTKYFGGFVAGAIGLTLALSGIGFVGSFVVGGILSIAKAATFMNLVFAANPIGLVIVGVMALIGLGMVLYDKFEPFKNLIDGILNSVGSVMSSIGSWFGLGDDKEITATKKMQIQPMKTATLKTPKVNTNTGDRDISIQTMNIIKPSSTADIELGVKRGLKRTSSLSDGEL